MSRRIPLALGDDVVHLPSFRITLLLVLSLLLPDYGLTELSYAQPESLSGRLRRVSARQRPLLQEALNTGAWAWGAPIFIRIFKAEKQLELWLKQRDGFRCFKTYPVCTYGRHGLGPKIRQGDGRAPEGFYYVTAQQMNPYSRFHLAFNIGYPNVYDRFHGYTGDALMVHGDCVSLGCYAMTDEAMEEIFILANAALNGGQPFFRVHIFPFKMTAKNMEKYRDSRWLTFWQNMKTGFDWFGDRDFNPPNVLVRKGRYVFENDSEIQ